MSDPGPDASRQVDARIEALGRGVEALYSLDELRARLDSGRRLRVKLGLDPTAPDIHLGHTVVLRKMRQFQDMGHLGVLIIGDYTARIGDPTGRDTTRPVLSEKQIEDNARTYLDQAGRILDTHRDKLEIRRNSEWLSGLTFADVLRLTGMITVQQMLQRDNFKQRMRHQTEIMLSEFMYPIMQGYDSIAIEADVELGGTDQTFNCMAARELMARSGLAKQVVMVMPILAGLDGREKMSKSKGNYVGVAEDPHEMYGKLMSIPDALMPNYFELLTDLPVDRIQSLTNAQTTHPRQAKDILGRIVVEEFHDRESANRASEEFRRRFSEHQLPTDLETRTVAASPIGLLRLLVEVGFASSNSDARRLVEGGGVSLDGAKLGDPTAEVAIEGQPVLKVGKRRICRVAVKS
jgi:tyrosyl-tRNA synthetase